MTVELLASTFVGIAGSLAGLVFVGVSLAGIAVAVGSGLVLFAATIGVIFLIHLALAPRGLHIESQQEIATHKTRLEKLTEHKLIFEIDERSTRVHLYESPSHPLTIAAKIKLRFENKDIHPMSMKRLNVTLHELQPEKLPKDVSTIITFMYSSNGIPVQTDEFEGMMIQDRRLTPFYLVEAVMVIDDEEIKSSNDLTGLHFLRLTMDAGAYQAPFSGDLFLSWKHALSDKGTGLTITFNAPTIRADYRRF